MKLESGDQDLSCQILQIKYLGEGGFFQSSSARGRHSFGKACMLLSNGLAQGVLIRLAMVVGFASARMFGVDEVPLSVHFFRLFRCCEQQGETVAEVLRDEDIHLSFRRSFGPEEQVEWEELCLILERVQLSDSCDQAYWCLTKNKRYATQSLYSALLHSGVRNLEIMDLWKASIPLKHKIFVWLGIQGRIQVTEELAKKGWPGERGCKLCGEPETADHVLLLCPIASFVWVILRDSFGWSAAPQSFGDFRALCLLKEGPSRHKWCVQGTGVSYWKTLLHEKRREPTMKMVAKVLEVLQLCVKEEKNRKLAMLVPAG
ncbi:hypothetical protein BRADI_4g17885v3 [Brachypodium distachyon]|uniref:Reverse transcriptase zinc-binding domain-containing protein n=1 Tax=Brachypodium distachyon TaxID=15368 RepID=A0A2K2CNG7_BRADI|nr:hypothetical protein BRADI_4g17885v3 [Brachypodium distachyon]